MPISPGTRAPTMPERPSTTGRSPAGSTAASRALAVPLGASTFWLWWVSTISTSHPASASATSAVARRRAATPSE